eukprot:1392398-Amorphochlora_amoeboformis.AAC.1
MSARKPPLARKKSPRYCPRFPSFSAPEPAGWLGGYHIHDDKVSAAPVRSTSRMALRPMIRTSPRVHMRSRMYVAKDDKMVPDK